MSKLFISFSSKDGDLARGLVANLQSQGVSCWFSEQDIKPGENYGSSIIRGLDSADCLLLLYTKHSNASPEVHKEIERASSKRKLIIPVRFDDVKYDAALEYHLGIAQWINAIGRKREDVYGDILRFVTPGASPIKVHDKSKRRLGIFALLALTAVVAAVGFMLPSGGGENGRKVMVRDAATTQTNQDSDATPKAVDLHVSTNSTPTDLSGNKRVAILYFDNTGKSEELETLRKGFADMLITDMNGKGGLTIVEREKLQAVLAEMKLQGSQTFDAASAAKVGKLLGAEYLVTGSFFELMGQFRVDAKVMHVETGVVTIGAGATGAKEEFMQIERALAGELVAAIGKNETGNNFPKQKGKLSYADLKTYSRILDLIDRGEKTSSLQQLKLLIQSNPDFEPAVKLAKKNGV